METATTSAKERLAYLLAEQAKDSANLKRLRASEEQIANNMLVRAGRIDELKLIAAKETDNGG